MITKYQTSIKVFDSFFISGWLILVAFYPMIDVVPAPEVRTNSEQDLRGKVPPKIIQILMKWLCSGHCPKKHG